MIQTNDKPIILIINDKPMNINILTSALRDEHHIEVANNGQTAIQIALMHPKPDLILLDMMMPDMDGFEVCRKLKDNSETKHIPIIFVTTKNDSADEAQCLELGAIDYITEPFNARTIKARVQNQLKLKRQTDDLIAQQNASKNLQNHELLHERFSLTRAIAQRKEKLLGLMLINLNCFNQINDSMDATTLNRLLAYLAKNLSQCVRQTDTIARLNDDKFIIILSEIKELANIAHISEVILKNLTKPFSFENHKLELSPSVGISIYPQHGNDLETLIGKANIAACAVENQENNISLIYETKVNELTSIRKSKTKSNVLVYY